MKSKIKQILNTITPQDLEDGCSRQVEEIEKLVKKENKEEKEEIKQKDIAVTCDTIEEWRAVLDKLFDEGKKWSFMEGKRDYKEKWFYSEYSVINFYDDVICRQNLSYSKEFCKVISAKEFLELKAQNNPPKQL